MAVEFFGAVLGMAIFGGVLGWIWRNVFPLTINQSYALGISLMTFPAAWAARKNGIFVGDYLAVWITYALAGVLGYFVPVGSSRAKKIGRKTPSSPILDHVVSTPCSE